MKRGLMAVQQRYSAEIADRIRDIVSITKERVLGYYGDHVPHPEEDARYCPHCKDIEEARQVGRRAEVDAEYALALADSIQRRLTYDEIVARPTWREIRTAQAAVDRRAQEAVERWKKAEREHPTRPRRRLV